MSERDRHGYDYEKQAPKSRTRTELEQCAAELEALGLGIAPGLPGDDRSERERAEIGAG